MGGKGRLQARVGRNVLQHLLIGGPMISHQHGVADGIGEALPEVFGRAVRIGEGLEQAVEQIEVFSQRFGFIRK